jgi:ABC-type multidrug transport system fused ATPase/permease subunit
VVEEGSHTALIGRGGVYADLQRVQQGTSVAHAA